MSTGIQTVGEWTIAWSWRGRGELTESRRERINRAVDDAIRYRDQHDDRDAEKAVRELERHYGDHVTFYYTPAAFDPRG